MKGTEWCLLFSDREAFLQFGLRSNLGQHLLDEMACMSQSGLTRLGVGRRAGELTELGTDRLFELREIMAPGEDQLGAHETHEVQNGGHCRRSSSLIRADPRRCHRMPFWRLLALFTLQGASPSHRPLSHCR
jgi:hypothetical protein